MGYAPRNIRAGLAHHAGAAHADGGAVYRHGHGGLSRHRGHRRRGRHQHRELADRQLHIRPGCGLSFLHRPGLRRRRQGESLTHSLSGRAGRAGDGHTFYHSAPLPQRAGAQMDAGGPVGAGAFLPLFLYHLHAHARPGGHDNLRHHAPGRGRH